MAVNRTKTPWVILHGHRPIYTCVRLSTPMPGFICVQPCTMLLRRELRSATEILSGLACQHWW